MRKDSRAEHPAGPALAPAPDTVTIESLASGGAGVGHLADGMAVFVPRTAPGDRVVLRELRRHRRHAEARVGEILEPGPGRVSPPCVHFARDRCGGCQWQHLAPAAQQAARRRIVGDALRRIGGLDVPDPPITPSPRPFHYRATVTLTVRWRGSRAVVGFHDAERPDRVFPLETCAIAREELNALWAALRPSLDALPRGDDVRLKLRLAADGARHVLVEGGERAWSPAAAERLAGAARAGGAEASVWWQPSGGHSRRLAGPAADPASVAFEQVHPEVAAALRAAVIEAALAAPTRAGEARAPSGVLDLYAGAGDVALALAARGLDVTAVEQDERAVRRAEARADPAGRRPRLVAGRVEDHLAGLLPADVVIVNPPRGGLADAVTACLSAHPPARLIYVSCDPATLARDLRRLGVRAADLAELRAWDMFPQTSHVETLVVADPRR